ncbi:Beta-lactamase class A [Pedococcus dokdonensis]|uniref:Beta-lactamase class A n=1 Tax=Pedococcus dokdonensis TaxID=443156 RepID=A0A1H0TRJ0_9MICO|nr:hypothetical protein [Pedococcus dokdonensis]SDP56589.1 Beta-lactamase class A [Pedococcus dokdonensis]
MLTRRHVLTVAPLALAAACAGEPAAGTTASPGTTTAGSAATTTTTTTPPSATTTASPPAPTTTTTTTTGPPSRPTRAPTLDALRDELSALARRYGADLGVAVAETRSGRSFAWGAESTIETASIAKADILATLLLQLQDRGARPSASQLAVADKMIRQSDHESAWTLFRQVGLASGMTAANRRFGLRSTQCFDYSWGLTRTTARDQLRFVHAISSAGSKASPLDARSGKTLLDLMEDVIPEQKWGLRAAARSGERVCLKNGWLPRSTLGGLWIVNSIGRITDRSLDLRVAILSQKTTSKEQGIALVEQAAVLTRRHLAV